MASRAWTTSSDGAYGVGGAFYGSGEFTDVLFENCSASCEEIHHHDGSGGAVYQPDGLSSFTRAVFRGCDSDCKGGGVFVAGGVALMHLGRATA